MWQVIASFPSRMPIGQLLNRSCFLGLKIGTNQLANFNACMRNKGSYADGEELHIPVPYGHMAAKTWGPSDGIPVLALHGWLDNCGTFDRLLPMLSKRFYFVALDLPGHGLSSHRPAGCFYSHFDMVTDVKRVFHFFSWNKITIIGHSMGGEIGVLYASIYPQAVDKLILLDVISRMPHFRPDSELPECAALSIEANLDIELKLSRSPPVYSPDSAIQRLLNGRYNEITPESASILLKRGSKISADGSGLIFTRDLRIETIEIYNAISHSTAEEFASRIKCEMLLLTCTGSNEYKRLFPDLNKRFIDMYKKNCSKFVLEEVNGNHFVHLNDAAVVSPSINKFLISEET